MITFFVMRAFYVINVFASIAAKKEFCVLARYVFPALSGAI